jgi:transducin (beta)-like 1
VDKTTIVWDAATGEPRHSYAFHNAPVLDLDWLSDSAFASCGTDKAIHVCSVGSSAPTRTFLGHTDEVNSVRWAPSRSLLASGSDDGTVRLWSAGGEGAPPPGALATLTGHRKPVYCVRWAPGGEAPASAPTLASASYDATVRLWDAAAGKARATLAHHSALVYSVVFSPDGALLASTSADRVVCLWSARDGALLRTFAGPAACYDAAFSPDGGKLAACYASGAVAVLDLRL